MLGMFLLAASVLLTMTMFLSRQMMLGFPCVIFWAIFGGYCYQQSAALWDIYYLTFIGSTLGMTVFCAFAMYALRTKKQEQIEGDALIDEDKDEERFVDEGNGRGELDALDNKKSSRVQGLRKRASDRRRTSKIVREPKW